MNSVRFVVDMLAGEGIEVKQVEVVDNNCIHREVAKFKPTHVFIEALWVVPEKFDVLHALNPEVNWIIRGHSEIPFLAVEGIAMDWCIRYVGKPNVYLASNSDISVRDLKIAIRAAYSDWTEEEVDAKVVALPNFYPVRRRRPVDKLQDEYVDVCCFGAIRPLKNQLIQALAAIEYADRKGRTLRFHVNGTRCEQGGQNVQRNLRALFLHSKHQLIEHGWMHHSEFLECLQGMDLGMQVSFSETFNIVAADMAVTGLPIVTSSEIPWSTEWCQAEPTNSKDIVNKMMRATGVLKAVFQVLNLRGLRRHGEHSKYKWLQFLRGY
jgi:hypothetical protein